MTDMNGPAPDHLTAAESRAALDVPDTPAYVYSETVLNAVLTDAHALASNAGCSLLYTLKPCGLSSVIETIAAHVEGFSASSLYETKLVSELGLGARSLHCYSPGFSASEMASIVSAVDYLTLNSFTQLELAASVSSRQASLGIRLNPQIGFAADSRYDPCRPNSKLGVPLSDFEDLLSASEARAAIRGVHVHNNCESNDLGQLSATVEAIGRTIERLDDLAWVNLGGGYYLGPDVDPEPLREAIRTLKARAGLTVFIEPGTALVQQAGMLVSEVLDVFRNDGKQIAVLDTSTSHMPEVFEYGFTPTVRGPAQGGDLSTIIAGRSCLAGDIFGEYRLCEPLRQGDRVVIMDAGSYAQSRAAPFNGIPLPSSYMLRASGGFDLIASYGYADFAVRNGMAALAPA